MPGWSAAWRVGETPEPDVAPEFAEPQVPVNTDWRVLVAEHGGVIHEGG